MDIETYIKELGQDTIVNELNLKEKSLTLPGLKAKWVARLIKHKNSLNSLEKRKKLLIRNILPKVRESLPVKLSDNVIKESAEGTKEIQDINEHIEAERSIIDFLEKSEKVMTSFTYDISNIIKIVQLETL